MHCLNVDGRELELQVLDLFPQRLQLAAALHLGAVRLIALALLGGRRAAPVVDGVPVCGCERVLEFLAPSPLLGRRPAARGGPGASSVEGRDHIRSGDAARTAGRLRARLGRAGCCTVSSVETIECEQNGDVPC